MYNISCVFIYKLNSKKYILFYYLPFTMNTLHYCYIKTGMSISDRLLYHAVSVTIIIFQS